MRLPWPSRISRTSPPVSSPATGGPAAARNRPVRSVHRRRGTGRHLAADLARLRRTSACCQDATSGRPNQMLWISRELEPLRQAAAGSRRALRSAAQVRSPAQGRPDIRYRRPRHVVRLQRAVLGGWSAASRAARAAATADGSASDRDRGEGRPGPAHRARPAEQPVLAQHRPAASRTATRPSMVSASESAGKNLPTEGRRRALRQVVIPGVYPAPALPPRQHRRATPPPGTRHGTRARGSRVEQQGEQVVFRPCPGVSSSARNRWSRRHLPLPRAAWWRPPRAVDPRSHRRRSWVTVIPASSRRGRRAVRVGARR